MPTTSTFFSRFTIVLLDESSLPSVADHRTNPQGVPEQLDADFASPSPNLRGRNLQPGDACPPEKLITKTGKNENSKEETRRGG
jgi:hypothetical protein